MKQTYYLPLTLLFIFLTGCAVRPTLRDQERSLQKVREEIRVSEPIRFYLQDRTALIIDGKLAGLETSSERNDEGGFTYALEFEPNKGLSAGFAAALSEDGYFLTTAHEVDQRDVTVFYMASGRIQRARGRIVFECPDIDMALIKADVKCKHWFEFSEIETRVGQKVLASGGVQGNNVAGGKVRWVKRDTFEDDSSAFPYERFSTTLPIDRGGSGCPIVDLEGRLHGICTKAWHGLLPKLTTGYLTNGVKPSPTFLKSKIEEDRNLNLPETDKNSTDSVPNRAAGSLSPPARTPPRAHWGFISELD